MRSSSGFDRDRLKQLIRILEQESIPIHCMSRRERLRGAFREFPLQGVSLSSRPPTRRRAALGAVGPLVLGLGLFLAMRDFSGFGIAVLCMGAIVTIWQAIAAYRYGRDAQRRGAEEATR
jgi:hypothetical protein